MCSIHIHPKQQGLLAVRTYDMIFPVHSFLIAEKPLFGACFGYRPHPPLWKIKSTGPNRVAEIRWISAGWE